MAGPAPAVAAARLAVRACLADLPAGAHVVVACSGGADSLALAAATAFVAPRLGLTAGAVVVDHGLRTGSAAVARAAAITCRDLGLGPVEVRTVDATGPGGPEGAARHARYAALEAAATDAGAVVVLLGHTLDDQAETVLLGLGRGSGPRSLAGMPARTGRWRRPFLELRRAQTEACCRALGLRWEQDPTNAPDGPWRRADGGPLRRAALRHHVLPALADALGPGVPEALARTADRLREDEDYLTGEARALARRAGLAAAPSRAGTQTPPSGDGSPAPPAGDGSTDTDEPGSVAPVKNCTFGGVRGGGGGEEGVSLDVEVLAGAHPAVRGRVLHLAATAAGCPPGALAAVHVDALAALVTDYRGQGPLHLPGSVTARRECGRLTIGRQGRPAPGSE